jgi:hypothetical protein
VKNWSLAAIPSVKNTMLTREYIIKLLLSTGAAFYLAYIDIYGDFYRTWPKCIAIPLTLGIIAVAWAAANFDTIELVCAA